MARRAGAHTVETDASHCVAVSNPAIVAALIVSAARVDDLEVVGPLPAL